MKNVDNLHCWVSRHVDLSFISRQLFKAPHALKYLCRSSNFSTALSTEWLEDSTTQLKQKRLHTLESWVLFLKTHWLISESIKINPEIFRKYGVKMNSAQVGQLEQCQYSQTDQDKPEWSHSLSDTSTQIDWMVNLIINLMIVTHQSLSKDHRQQGWFWLPMSLIRLKILLLMYLKSSHPIFVKGLPNSSRPIPFSLVFKTPMSNYYSSLNHLWYVYIWSHNWLSVGRVEI